MFKPGQDYIILEKSISFMHRAQFRDQNLKERNSNSLNWISVLNASLHSLTRLQKCAAMHCYSSQTQSSSKRNLKCAQPMIRVCQVQSMFLLSASFPQSSSTYSQLCECTNMLINLELFSVECLHWLHKPERERERINVFKTDLFWK